MKKDALPIGSASLIIGKGALPTGKAALPTGTGALPVDRGSLPIGRAAPSIGKDTPTNRNVAPTIVKDALPIGRDAPPRDKGALTNGRNAPIVGKDALTNRKEAPTTEQYALTVGIDAPTNGKDARPTGKYAPTNEKDAPPIEPAAFANPTPQRRTAMAQTTKSIRRSTVTLQLPKSVPALILYAKGIVERMTRNTSFPNPSPSLTTVTTAIDALQAAEAAALSRTKGAAAARNEKRAALVVVLQQLKANIQSTADTEPANAASIIESAGVAVRKTPTRRARAFAAKPGKVSGTATIVAATAARRASYEWQYSTDSGKTWVPAPPTLQAKTAIAGLTPGATVQFKYRSVTRTGGGDWSEPVSLLVH